MPTKIERLMKEYLEKKYDERNVFHVDKNTFLILFCGEGYKFILGAEKGKILPYMNLKETAEFQKLSLELVEFELLKNGKYNTQSTTLYMGGL